MEVVKRNGKVVPFDKNKIVRAISKAGYIKDDLKERIASEIENIGKKQITIEEIQDLVEKKLMASSYKNVAKEYIRYRYKRELIREHDSLDNSVLEVVSAKNEYVNSENSNKNSGLLSTQRDYMAGEVSKEISRKLLLDDEIINAHDEGIIHFHDMDYFAMRMFNCSLINLEDMLQNGTCINGTKIEKPHSFSTACNIATQVMAAVASSQYGGQTESLAHIAPFVDVSRQNFIKEVRKELSFLKGSVDDDELEQRILDIAEERVKDEIKRGVQTIQYQILTLMTTNGQTPFVSINMYLNEVKDERTKKDLALIIEEVLKQRMQGIKNEAGAYITPAFPKLLYFLEDDNCKEGTEYWYLTELAAKCTAKRMVPDYISEKLMLEYKIDKNGNGNAYPCMGCRSFLTPYVDDDGKPKYYGRFNQGVVTINLPDVALTALKNTENLKNIDGYENIVKAEFWKIFDERLELCHKALQFRHQRLKGTPSDVSPIHWQYGALARLQKGETIDKLLYNGYSTISLGYAGLYECVKAITGHSHTSKEAKPFALEIMEYMNNKTRAWKEEEHIDYSLYGTPIETTTEKFAKNLRRRFGTIEGITDKNYITNSYHVHVTEQIDPFTKLKFESDFQRLSPGGCISYVECSDLTQNTKAVLEVIKFMYNNIMYSEMNTKSDYCHVCGYDGEIQIVEKEDGHLAWRCPNCGNEDQHKMNVARRTCGYIGSQFWGAGRTQEIKERVVHLGGNFTDVDAKSA